jgi:hypothetical protein
MFWRVEAAMVKPLLHTPKNKGDHALPCQEIRHWSPITMNILDAKEHTVEHIA